MSTVFEPGRPSVASAGAGLLLIGCLLVAPGHAPDPGKGAATAPKSEEAPGHSPPPAGPRGPPRGGAGPPARKGARGEPPRAPRHESRPCPPVGDGRVGGAR